MDCETTRERLTGYVEGWLDAADRRQVEAHVQTCQTCRQELDRERKLVSSLGTLPEPSVPAVAWKTTPRRSYRLATVTALLVVFVAAWHSIPLGPRQPVTAVGHEDSWSGANLALSAGDFGLDPNRAVVLARMEETRR